MTEFIFSEKRLIISNSYKRDKIIIPKKVFNHRVNLVKTIKKYIKKYYNFASNKNNILYLSILYIDIILSKGKLNLTNDKNLKYLCLCCFLLSLKFLGDYDLSKDIIRNFCQNYKEEYGMFEIQCLQLLDYNLIYTTAFDYLNMILNNNQKKLFDLCGSILNKICEMDLYYFYSPFYSAIAVMKLGKNLLEDKTYNYYDKYFNEQRVIFLYKSFSHKMNLNLHISKNLNMCEEILYEKNNNNKYYYNNRQNNLDNKNFSNVNIINNNIIQNKIIIINGTSNNENKENINNINYCTNNCLRTINSNSNMNSLKIIVNRHNRNRIDKVNFDKNNFNYNTSTYRISKIRQNKNKNENNFKGRNSLNNVFHYSSNLSLNKNHFENVKVSCRINNSINSENIKNQNKSSANLNRKIINSNKSSLNFTFLSNVPKEILYKLSRNISKKLGSSFDKISVNRCTSFK